MSDTEELRNTMTTMTLKLQKLLDKTNELNVEIIKIREVALETLIELSSTDDYSELSPDEQMLYDEYENCILNKLTRKKK
eukprot:SAG11_NODE_1495_length_4799_cov_1881.608723_2_plen_80_part_00